MCTGKGQEDKTVNKYMFNLKFENMKKISYFNEAGLSLSGLLVKSKTVIGFVERDLEELSEIGYNSGMLSSLQKSFNAFWETSPDAIEKSDAVLETAKRDELHEQLKLKMRHIIAIFRSVWPDGRAETLVFDKISISALSLTETVTNAKILLQFIEHNKKTFKKHALITDEYLQNYNQLLENAFWSILTAKAQYSSRSTSTRIRHLLAQDLYENLQTATMFGKITFMYDAPEKYNDYIIEPSGSNAPSSDEDVGEQLDLEFSENVPKDDEIDVLA